MEPAQFLSTFRQFHENAKRGTLEGDDAKRYVAMCDELARSLISSQAQQAPLGVPARRSFKVAQLFPVEINNVSRTMTREISCQGFTATITGSMRDGEEVTWALNLGRSQEPISGRGRVTAATKQGTGGFKVEIAFEDVAEEKLIRLERVLFDAALARIGG